MAAVRLIGSLSIYCGWLWAAGGRPGAARGGRGAAGDGWGRPGAAGRPRGRRGANIYKIGAGAGSPRAFIRYFLAVFNGRVVKSRGLRQKLFVRPLHGTNIVFQT